MIKGKTAVVSTRLPEALVAKLHRHARERGRTAADLLKEGLLLVLRKRPDEQLPPPR